MFLHIAIILLQTVYVAEFRVLLNLTIASSSDLLICINYLKYMLHSKLFRMLTNGAQQVAIFQDFTKYRCRHLAILH
jgi:hypothetical protein